ncbi:class I SAM-dependent methyltransferase [Streptomyces cinnabarinus]|uniref:Class I SAM-dependent methyltransferase n=1 Tax=Streptomyces cinnabarinus TaxID=67287 RepID=A0ABY7KLX3_9ACTN|nr:class I SAM-dependent methyltransferase [Streptomyces cinnabarinus]WAZ23696.1 class I SAM-dependent methyltransferase [Streptomyces cinnabarinus]
MTDPTTDPDFVRATRTSYDAIATPYTDRHPDSLAGHPLERALLAAFAEQVRAHGTAPVGDLGSGPGDVTARLHALGVPVFGVDVSPRMVALAREAHPHLRFHVGTMTSLDLPDETLGGITALYSTIHIPTDHLTAAFAEFHRVLVPGGHALLSFQTGDSDELMHLTERFGKDISLHYYLRTPETVEAHLGKAGLQVRARVVREPVEEETRARAFLLVRRCGG